MQDFNEYAKNNSKNNPETNKNGLFGLVSALSKKYDGKSQNELLLAIYQEAKKNKQNGTLTNEQIDAFAKTIAPVLDEKKRKILRSLVEEIKRI